MKNLLFCLLLLFPATILRGQDTIFMKSGAVIPATIIEAGDVEIKYKKFTSAESNGIYTVFKYEVKSLHYRNGNVIDYSNQGLTGIGNLESHPSGPNISGQLMKISFGISQNYFNRNESDNLGTFWTYHNNSSLAKIGGNPWSRSIDLCVNMPLGGNKRNWLAAGLQLMATPKDAISGSFYDSTAFHNYGLNELKLRTYYYNIEMIYGRSINYKKNLILSFESSLDVSFMTGNIHLDSTDYKNTLSAGMGSHFAIGLDWFISKRITANCRVGQRFLKIDEVHESKTSTTGYSTFYANPSINRDLLYVKWSGSYVSFGLSYSIYAKMKGK